MNQVAKMNRVPILISKEAPFLLLQQLADPDGRYLFLLSLSIVDSWCYLHPCGKDYTFFSTLHNKYSSIVYLFISQRESFTLHLASIGRQTLFDQAPVLVILDLLPLQPKAFNLRLHASLLTDSVTHKHIT